ncbi:MAG: nitroreductase [Alphaproteobacteria bacterium]|nr:nitroreductase [Alphaproteobacteria bacterium]
MELDEALATRRSIRAFRPDPVPEAAIRRMLEAAARAPSGGNLQPWVVHVVSGAARDRLMAHIAEKARATPFGEGSWYDEYPKEMPEVFRERRRKVGYDLYALAGIAREDKMARAVQLMRNFILFDAPVGLFFSTHRCCGIPQFVDLGMFMQSVMLMARAEGLDTCAQEAWGIWHETVARFVGLPEDHRVFCGMALGYADTAAPVNRLHTERAPVDEFATFLA